MGGDRIETEVLGVHLYDLDLIPWLDTQLLYHALARLGREGLILCRPASPYVCIGRHQDLEQEVDLAFCRERGIPIFRREVGGGAVYLDGKQLFYQLVLARNRPDVPADKEAFYRRFLAPVMATYQEIGIAVEYKPINDLLANGRKISGNGVAEIGAMVVFVGNLIMDFDYDTMVRVLRVPDEKFRDKVFKSLRENLTTIRRERGQVPPVVELRARLAANFARLLGPLEPAPVDDVWRQAANDLSSELTSDAWLYRSGRRQSGRQVHIGAGVSVHQGIWKAKGGLIRATWEAADGRITSATISGDFFIYPPEALDALQEHLVGCPLAKVEETIAAFYETHSIETPGISPTDLARAFSCE